MSNPDPPPGPIAQEDYRWVTAGISYLFEVNAKTRVQRSRLTALRRNIARRRRQTLGERVKARRSI